MTLIRSDSDSIHKLFFFLLMTEKFHSHFLTLTTAFNDFLKFICQARGVYLLD